MGEIRFKLRDADGVEHVYDLTPHTHSQGQQLFWALMAMGVEPIVQALDVFMRSKALAKGTQLSDLLDRDTSEVVSEILGDADLGALGPALRRSLVSTPLDVIGRDLLRYTNRDGKPLSDEMVIDQAYQRNWGEYVQALWKSVEINRFFGPLSSLVAAATDQES